MRLREKKKEKSFTKLELLRIIYNNGEILVLWLLVLVVEYPK